MHIILAIALIVAYKLLHKKYKSKLWNMLPAIFVGLVIIMMIATNGEKSKLMLEAQAQSDLVFGNYLTYEIENNPDFSKPFEFYDIDRLARAVAQHETGNCTLGYGSMYNNCFGIKNGRTAPCKSIGMNRMCIYDTPEDSYVAFKKIWSKWYNGMPTMYKAERWSGNDNKYAWYRNVTNFYNKNI
jgi:hypothetical protein